MGKRIPFEIQCPFYRRSDRSRWVACEGLMEGNQIVLVFEKPEDLRRQVEVFCCEHYRKCEIYRAAEEKYGD